MSVITLNNSIDQTVTPADLIWEDPPALKTATGRYAKIAAALRGKPGQWAVLRTYGATPGQKRRGWGFASSINGGKFIDFRSTIAGHYEATARTSGDGTIRVYVRFVPGMGEGA